MPSETIWVDGIPVVGYVKALIYCHRCEFDLASEAFKGTTHNTGATCFGVFGAHLAGSFGGLAGSITGALVGGMMGGLFADALIDRFSGDYYGYAVYENILCNRNMSVDDWLQLQLLIFKDGILGITALYTYTIAMPLLSRYYTENHDEMDINYIVEDRERVFEIYFEFYASSADFEPSVRDIIPIFGELNAFRRHCSERRNMAKTYKWVAHNAGVICFGVLGDRAGGIIGSILGGIIGGLFVDCKISEVTLTSSCSYGYASFTEKYWNGTLDNDEKIELALLALRDIFTIMRGSIEYDLIKKRMQLISNTDHQSKINPIGLFEETGRDVPGLKYGVKIQKDMSLSIYHVKNPDADFGKEIICLLDVCENPKFRIDDTELKYAGKIRKDMPGCTYLLKIPRGRINRVRRIIKFIKRRFAGSQIDPQFIANLRQLERGDHIVYERCYQKMLHLYDHHAIVEEIFPEKFKYRVYEQTSVDKNGNKLTGKAWIREMEKPFEAKSFYKKDHDNTGISKETRRKIAHYICHHASPAVFNKRYNVIFNNCEHFVNFCSTGLLESEQVQDFVASIVQMCIMAGIHLIGYTLMFLQYMIGFYLSEANSSHK